MTILDRAALQAKLTELQTKPSAASLVAKWAFDQFYAESEGTIHYEPGYRRVIAATLDDLMFNDDPAFHLDDAHVALLRDRLATAIYMPDEDNTDETDDDDEAE